VRGMGMAEAATLAPQAAGYLVARKRVGKVTDEWLGVSEGFLRCATAFWKTGKALGPESVRWHPFTLSAVYRFARAGEVCLRASIPVRAQRRAAAWASATSRATS
jgi:hypothetical protein